VTTPEGESLIDHWIDSSRDMVWGDAPADSMDHALIEIIATFRRDVGRAPSLDELLAGLKFSAKTALEDDEERRVKADLKTFEVVSRWEWDGFGGADAPSCTLESDFYEATDQKAAEILWVADRNAEADEHMGLRRIFVSIEQIDPPVRQLSLVPSLPKKNNGESKDSIKIAKEAPRPPRKDQ
jgi:hypothetical protein